MLTRRHIRVKVLQSIYALNQGKNPDLSKQEKFLFYSIDQMHDLYLLMLQLMIELRDHAENYLDVSKKKHLATQVEKNPSRTFVENKVLRLIESNAKLKTIIQKKGLNYWAQDSEYIGILFKSLIKQDWYESYLLIDKTSYSEDQNFVLKIYKEIIAPNEKLYEYLEDKRLTWVDDFPIVNTAMVKILGKLSEKNVEKVLIPELYKDDEDRNFALELFRNVVNNEEKLSAEIDGKTPNWDQERIAELDLIILKMGITEFLYFPSIPVRATINEYLEISKEYSTPKSSIFINGILDKLVKEFEISKKLNKIGRGLQ